MTSVLIHQTTSHQTEVFNDVIVQWNAVYRDVIRATNNGPGPIARVAAMMHGAMYDAVNSIEQTHLPYIIQLPTPDATSVEAAAVCAAHRILTETHLNNPAQSNLTLQPEEVVKVKTIINDAFDRTMGDIAGRVSEAALDNGKILGWAIANAMIAKRSHDGASNTELYTPGTNPGDWRPTEAGTMAVTPNWGKLAPFAINFSSQFRPPLPAGYQTKADLLCSTEYAAQVNEVKRLGKAQNSDRTTEQTDIAFFWANDVAGTYKPPGHLYEITQTVAQQRKLSLSETARLFALVTITLADAAILAWDMKYDTDIDLWRPASAIREADTDGNPETIKDENWEPLSINPMGKRFSPPFPAYISGHATFGAAHSGVMRNFFGTDNITFTAGTDDPNAKCVKRTFNSFTAAALENGRSRVYLGVHYQWDADAAYVSATRMADFVTANYMLPVDVHQAQA